MSMEFRMFFPDNKTVVALAGPSPSTESVDPGLRRDARDRRVA